jgi:hypothetical protein
MPYILHGGYIASKEKEQRAKALSVKRNCCGSDNATNGNTKWHIQHINKVEWQQYIPKELIVLQS